MKNFFYKHRYVLFRIFDIFVIAICYILAQAIFSNNGIRFNYQDDVLVLINTIIIAIVTFEAVMGILRMYRHMVTFENGEDYLKYILACFITAIFVSTIEAISTLEINTMRVNALAFILASMAIVGYRVFIRTLRREREEEKADGRKKNVLIIGAGNASKQLLDILKGSMKNLYNVVGLIDDNDNKKNSMINGVKIIGNRYDIPRVCKEKNVETILFSISHIDSDSRKKILELCQETPCRIRVLPSTKDLIKNKSIMGNLRDVEIEDLLGRDPVKLDNKNIEGLIKNQVVLVTGGGGSIGSELCRQIMKHKPAKLVILDIYENNLYDIEQELKFNFPKANVDAVVASVRDEKRLEEIFEQYQPYLVFHAAAHKHVPLMEGSPLEAIKNNVFGTYNVVNMADKFKVKRFVLISTDKAVNPTNIMGATKRLCEMIIQAKAKVSKTEFVAVRFGNVLGSNGSVIPLFKKQIASGGPVYVTHKEITRFFMTIPEAVSLVLQAMSLASGGEIFVLDMGEPVKIYDMAKKLIKLSGFEPDVDIKIEITGLRPGEKLYEEVLMAEEGLTETKHEKIHIAKPSEFTMEDIEEKLGKLSDVLDKEEKNRKHVKNYEGVDRNKVKEVMMKVVPTFKPAEYNFNSTR
ncbi:MAG: polysaccharide biosynthesis protein [Clostridia bacterium]|nr:polysaccharide biosynthesis protein [Clostridia bacterium]